MIIYNTFLEVCHELRMASIQHSASIVCADNKNKLLIGWMCVSPEEEARHLRLMSIKNRQAPTLPLAYQESVKIMNCSTEYWEYYNKNITSTSGRNKIAQDLSFDSEPNMLNRLVDNTKRIWDLRAFW